MRDLHPLRGERNFAWRGIQVSRVEALSDMVFAFALTLLVVSEAPPRSFAELIEQLWGFPGFAAGFAILLLIWHSHYIYFRRYALEDGWASALNAGLLFLILFLVYPLKYLATMLSQFVRSLAFASPQAPLTLAESQQALILLSVGYAGVFLMFAALYAHALGREKQLGLTAQERALTWFSFWQQAVHMSVAALVAVVAALLPIHASPYAGFLYCLIGPLIVIAGLFVPAWTRESARA
ncbi:MAG: TMEM175 family protein [Terricaulis sp.]